MRPAGKGPLESLYFNYPIFPSRRVAELDGATARHPVAIVGAGPIGITAALVLARYGVRSVLIDRKETFNDGSRALCIARVSMHILERIGVVTPFLRHTTEMQEIGDFHFKVSQKLVHAARFPDLVKLADGRVLVKPPGW